MLNKHGSLYNLSKHSIINIVLTTIEYNIRHIGILQVNIVQLMRIQHYYSA